MKLLSPGKAAERIGCSRAHIYALVEAQKLKRYFIGIGGGTLRVSEEDVEAFIAAAETPVKDGAA